MRKDGGKKRGWSRVPLRVCARECVCVHVRECVNVDER